MENFKMVEVKDAPRVELHNQLGLTAAKFLLMNFRRRLQFLSSMPISRMKKFMAFWAARASSTLTARSLISKQVTGL